MRAAVLALIFLSMMAPDARSQQVPAWLNPMPIAAILRLSSQDATCSAVAVGPYEALTAEHCVPKQGTYLTRDIFGTRRTVKSIILHPTLDLALIQVASGAGPFRQIAEVSNKIPNLGEIVFLAGYGCFGRLDIRPGVYDGPDTPGTDLRVGAAMCHGDSGGPVFDDQGHVIALNRAMPSERIPVGYETPVTKSTLELLRSRAK